MANRLSYVSGDYRSQSTFDKLREALAGHKNPLYYLAIPPSLFETVADGLDKAGIAKMRGLWWKNHSGAILLPQKR